MSSADRFGGTRESICDIPTRTFEETLEFIKKNVEFDMVLVLGDLISQDSWNYQTEDFVNNNQYVFDKIMETFWGDKTSVAELGAEDVLILPVNGNHDSEKLNYENYDDPSDFVKTSILPQFERFIGSSNVEQMKKKGYYEVEDPVRGIRYVGVDSNINYIYNVHSSADSTNPMNFIYNLGSEA